MAICSPWLDGEAGPAGEIKGRVISDFAPASAYEFANGRKMAISNATQGNHF